MEGGGQICVSSFITDPCDVLNLISSILQDELHRLIGIFVVNGVSLEARQKSKRAINGICGKALFPTFALINHDCLANASFTVDTASHPR